MNDLNLHPSFLENFEQLFLLGLAEFSIEEIDGSYEMETYFDSFELENFLWATIHFVSTTQGHTSVWFIAMNSRFVCSFCTLHDGF